MQLDYVKISRDALLKAGTSFHKDVYIRTKRPDGKTEHVLFAAAGLGPGMVRSLASSHPGALYIKTKDLQDFLIYIEKHVENIANDDEIPFDDKVDIVYSCAQNVVRDVFEDPRAGENIQRSKDVVNGIVSLTLRDPGTIRGLLSMGHKDYYTFSHCVHVAVFCIGLAKAFQIANSRDLLELGLGAILHDVGKTKIDNRILNKPGRLTGPEFEEVKKHPRFGYDMLKDRLPERSLDVILHHHEKYNGAGYPDKLSKGQITLFAKIACLADVYDALTTNRVYAKARAPFEALMTMKQEMMGQFEEEKFLAFVKMLGPGGTR